MILALGLVVVALWYFRGRQAAESTHEEPVPLATLDGVAADEVVTNELVVDFRDDEPADRIAALQKQLGVQFTAQPNADADKIYTVDTDDAGVLAALRANPDVEAADFDFVYAIPEESLNSDDEGLASGDEIDPSHKDFPNDPKYKFQWHMEQIHTKQAWKAAQGEGVIVA